MAVPTHRGWGRHIHSLLRSAALIGPVNSARAIAYSVHRDRLDAKAFRRRSRRGREGMRVLRRPRRDRGGRAEQAPRIPGRLLSAGAMPGGGRFTFTDASLDVRCLRGGGVFVAWDGATPLPSYALVGGETGQDASQDAGDKAGRKAGREPEWDERARLASAGDCWTVRAGDLTVTVGPGGRLTFTSADRETSFRRDEPPWWEGEAWTHRSVLSPDAMVLGLGGRAAGLDRRPGRYRLWNSDPGGTYVRGDDPLSMCLPVSLVVTDAGSHLAFYDNSSAGSVTVGDEIAMQLPGGPLRYYVLPGPPERALDGYTALTGRPALPPRWALGFHQSRWAYGSEAAMREMVAEYRRRDLPLSGVWLDIDHLDRRRVFTVDEERYPDIGGFAADLAKGDIHLVAIVDPAIPRRRSMPLYRDGLAADAYCRDLRGRVAHGVVWPGTTVYPDFTAARARAWWGDQHAKYVRLGIDGFWNDMNEPSAFAAWGDPSLPASTQADLDGRGGDHREAHNLYGLTMNRATFEGVRRLRPDRRPFLLTRAGWAGVQRYAGTWTGDIASRWDNLAVTLSFTLGLGASGVPYSGPDIGGFDGHPPAELFVRWFELAAYLPFFRSHCAKSTPPREPWAYGPEVLEQVRGVLEERYALLPYWYTLAWEAHRTGLPYVRPLAWEDTTDHALRKVDDAFLLGGALLVAPVLVEGARERVVRLPAGRWYERRTGAAHDGPGDVVVDASLGRPPVFVRAGAVLPTEERRPEDGTTAIVLEAYPPGPAQSRAGGGRLVSDSGDGYAEPVDERFTIVMGPDGRWLVEYSGPASALPYAVRWRG
ncbi:glycoside hydrolase family 31 protein [Actinopolymorpha sp. B9G3]|uniref:glycoside hydrolase family 31 protein n=1 Tax=Actinopolymorpha sp. B9G3 TaxID=3158970 RepID=UPI0032D91555